MTDDKGWAGAGVGAGAGRTPHAARRVAPEARRAR